MFDREFSPSRPGLPLDVATLEELRGRVANDALMERPGRLYFHIVIICTGGEGLHEVDFTPVNLKSGRLVHVRPGQVHRWRFSRSYEATILFFGELPPVLDSLVPAIGPQWRDLGREQYERCRRLIDLTTEELSMVRSPQRRDQALAGARNLLAVNLGIDQDAEEAAHEGDVNLPVPYVELMKQFETKNDWSRSVTDRAKRLGYSARTLTRACQAAVDRTAKEVIDDRVMLEARRLLINRDNTVDQVARQLSFSEASNFAKFFHRLSGENPEAWRIRQLGIDGS